MMYGTSQVTMDSLGNRKGMDVSFWLVESLTVGGSSYTSGLEAARYHSAPGTLQVRRRWFRVCARAYGLLPFVFARTRSPAGR